MMARLACFYGKLDPRVQQALERYAPQAGLEVEWVETPGPDRGEGATDVYARELEKRWTGEDDLILVEQDKEIFADTLPDLLGCAEPWCSCTYWIYPQPHTALALGGFGVTRFSAQVQRMVSVPEFEGACQLGIDRRFLELLKPLGVGCCLHGHVVHHHVYEPRPQAVRDHVASLRAQGILPPAVYPEPADPGLLPGSYRLT